MDKLKRIFRPIYVPLINYKSSILYKRLQLILNFYKDYKLFKKYSLVFHRKDIKNKEADLILHYHSLEKGMLFENMRKGFAANRIKNLHSMLKDHEVIENAGRKQIRTAYQIMCKYYELHKERNYDINDLFPAEKYYFYKKMLSSSYSKQFTGSLDWESQEFFKFSKSNFENFAHSRKSVRDFTGEKFDLDLIHKVINLANTAPSVCNRQASNVYLIEDKTKIDRALKIQAGFVGYSQKVHQLLILTNDRKYYYTVGERNQFYIDGGVYLMNLLYALHYYEIGNCPANWGKTSSADHAIRKFLKIPESEKIICMIPIGKVKNEFRTTLSLRRTYKENLIIK
jgi:nitroreductase